MNRRAVLAVVLSVFVMALLAPTATASDAVVAQAVESDMQASTEPIEVLVTFDSENPSTVEGMKREAASSQTDFLGYANSTSEVRVLNTFWITNSVLVEVEPSLGYEPLLDIGDVRSLDSNYEMEILGSASVTFSSHASTPRSIGAFETATASTDGTYGIDQINAPDVWSEYGTTGEGVNVAVLDTGVNVSHPDIDLHTTNASDLSYPGGWAEFDGNGDRVTGSEPYDPHGHGTHVSGTVAGEHTGVSPGVNLMHGLVMDDHGSGTLTQVLSGIEWAIDNDADIISLSLGGDTNDVWIDVAENTNTAGVLLVSAVGNDGEGTSGAPGNVYDAVGVGAVDSGLGVPNFSGGEVIDTESEWGNAAPDHWSSEYVVPDVVSAGVNVNSTSTEGGYSLSSGTSMATPHVAGAAALVTTATGVNTPHELNRAFRLTAHSSGSTQPGTRYGHGVADALGTTQFLLDDASVSGTVTDESDSQVNEATVLVNGVHISSNGQYEVDLSEGGWEFVAKASGYKETVETVSLSEDEAAQFDLVLEEIQSPFFEVSGLTGPLNVESGEEITASASITNTGETTGEQEVTFRLAEEDTAFGTDTVAAAEQVVLDGGDGTIVSFTFDAPDDDGEYHYGIFTDNDSATSGLTVNSTESAFFEVTDLTAPETVKTGELFDVSATVTNTGDLDGEKDVQLTVGGDTEAVRTEKIDAGGGLTVDFEGITVDEAGSTEVVVSTEDDTESTTVIVENPAPSFFDITDISPTQATVTPEDELTVTATVTNTGELGATKPVLLSLEGDEVNSSMLTLEPQDTGGASLSMSAPADVGEYAYSVSTGDSSKDGILEVEELLYESPIDGVSDGLWTAVTGDGNLRLADLGTAIHAYRANPNDARIDGERIRLIHLGRLITYYRGQVG